MIINETMWLNVTTRISIVLPSFPKIILFTIYMNASKENSIVAEKDRAKEEQIVACWIVNITRYLAYPSPLKKFIPHEFFFKLLHKIKHKLRCYDSKFTMIKKNHFSFIKFTSGCNLFNDTNFSMCVYIDITTIIYISIYQYEKSNAYI